LQAGKTAEWRNAMARSKQIVCPICEERFELEPDLAVGDTTSCPSCYADLKILSLHPLEVEEVNGIESINKDEDMEDDDADFGDIDDAEDDIKDDMDDYN